jgi:hypothetical protein
MRNAWWAGVVVLGRLAVVRAMDNAAEGEAITHDATRHFLLRAACCADCTQPGSRRGLRIDELSRIN